MKMEQKITKAIEEGLSPTRLEVINESYKHAGHAGDDGSGQTHFKLIIVSDGFTGHGRVQRQRMVNTMLKNLFEDGLHAISMQLFTLGECDIKS